VQDAGPARTRSAMPLPADLDGWLAFVERLHPSTIALGLERVRSVLARLAIPKSCPIVVVGGTNGKGPTCDLLEAMLGAAGYRVGCYTSPHLLRYAERVRVAGRELGDAALVAAFAEVERARRDTPLTYFEFGTLAAWVAFARARLEALVLEIGLGGRLDAVNAFEPDCAILTGVDLDHMDYLGATRERIGWEKAHIFRPGRPAIVGDPNPPATIACSGATGGRAARAQASRIPPCAARRSSPTPRPRSRPWTACGARCPSRRRRSGTAWRGPSCRGGSRCSRAVRP